MGEWDVALAAWVNRLGAGVIDPLTEAFCAVPPYVALLLVLMVIALWRTDRRGPLGVAFAVAAGLHVLVNEILLKHVLGLFRMRPYLAHPDQIVPVGYPFEDSSFPSSHTASAAAAMTVLCVAFPKVTPAGIVFVLTMAACRVHNGMHYPTDVLVGGLLGLCYGISGVLAGMGFERMRGQPSGSSTSS